MKRLIVYVHGKGGSAQEAEHYKSLFPKDEVIGFDYRSQTPWQAKKEFFAFFTEQRGRCEHLTLVANSIGAFFALSSLDETLVDRAYFISPILDMENLICNMMQWSNVTEQELALTSIETVSAFAKLHHADLTVIPGGEHWFHTDEQMQFLDKWIRERSLNDVCG